MPVIDVLDSSLYFAEFTAPDGTQGGAPDRAPDGGADPGLPFVFLHGNPVSSHVWRHVLPAVGGGRRLLAPDLIGMGRSGRPELDFSPAGFYADQARYLDAWFDALGIERAVLVGLDWGGSLALDRAARLPGRVAGVALMETILRPVSWAEFPEQARERWTRIKTPGVGETMVLEQDAFAESFAHTVLGGLTDADLAAYRAPYPTPESRRPLLAWARSMPIAGDPPAVVDRVTAYGDWLATSPDVPKLLLTFEGSPTLIVDPAAVAWCERHATALETVACGPAGHQAPEDQPLAIAGAITAWADRHGLATRQK
ncbi:haloalkane dehalogenase [Streptomyces sp. NPDC090025]|uniref:haloalkane dehalogenase n=1 Tax=Streptomyces sp. NPDC090025 TaxID=3365922 RepID=UPI003833E24A